MEGRWLRNYRTPRSAEWLSAALAATSTGQSRKSWGSAVSDTELTTKKMADGNVCLRTASDRLLVTDPSLAQKFTLYRVYEMPGGRVVQVYKPAGAPARQRGRWVGVDCDGVLWLPDLNDGVHCFRRVYGSGVLADAMYKALAVSHAPQWFKADKNGDRGNAASRRAHLRRQWAAQEKAHVRSGDKQDFTEKALVKRLAVSASDAPLSKPARPVFIPAWVRAAVAAGRAVPAWWAVKCTEAGLLAA